MKKIFFSGSNDERLIGKNARRMMMHLSIPVDEDLQQTLSFFEKVEYVSQIIIVSIFSIIAISCPIYLIFITRTQNLFVHVSKQIFTCQMNV